MFLHVKGVLVKLKMNAFFLVAFSKVKSKGLPRQAEVAQGVPGRLRPRITLTFRHYKGGRSSAKRTGRLYPKSNPWYSLSEADLTSGHVVL
jgi:hypothetical protein